MSSYTEVVNYHLKKYITDQTFAKFVATIFWYMQPADMIPAVFKQSDRRLVQSRGHLQRVHIQMKYLSRKSTHRFAIFCAATGH